MCRNYLIDCMLRQARTSWQWHQYLRARILEKGLTPLRLNVDETSIVLNHDDEKGVINKNAQGKVILIPKKSKKRGSLTHVALVCDDNTVQPLLPQFIIGNEHVLRVTDLTEIESSLAHNIIVIRAKSSWVTVELFIVLLEMLRKVLNAHNVRQVPILLLDCCPVHLHPRLWKAARTLCMYLCFVPAGLTWLLQPLDVLILRREKACLRALYRGYQVANETAYVPVIQIVRNIAESIRRVLQGSKWDRAFDVCGYSDTHEHLTSCITSILRRVNMVGVPIDAGKPNDADLLQMLPSKRRYDLHWLFWECVTAVPVPPMSAVGHDVLDGPPAKKTRVPASSSSGFPSRLSGVH